MSATIVAMRFNVRQERCKICGCLWSTAIPEGTPESKIKQYYEDYGWKVGKITVCDICLSKIGRDRDAP